MNNTTFWKLYLTEDKTENIKLLEKEDIEPIRNNSEYLELKFGYDTVFINEKDYQDSEITITIGPKFRLCSMQITIQPFKMYDSLYDYADHSLDQTINDLFKIEEIPLRVVFEQDKINKTTEPE